jgi:FHS family glucose/mannose:H+ symporter-like MFS transporter
MTPAPVVRPGWRPIVHVAFVLTGIVNTVLGPLVPWLAARWSLSDSATGFLFTLQFAGSLAGGAASGRIAARLGESRTLSAGFALMTGGMLALGLGARAVGQTGIAISGIGLGLVIPTTNLLVARLEPHRPAAALGGVNLAWGLGAALWPLVVAAVGPLTGVRVALLVVSAPLAAVGLRFALIGFPASPVVQGSEWSSSRSATAARIALFGLMFTLYGGTEAALGGWMAEYTRRVGHTLTVHWEYAATAFWGGLVTGRAAVALRLSGRREGTAALAGLTLAACSVLVLLMASQELAVTMAAILAGIGLSPVFPVTVAALSRELSASVGGPLIALGGLGGATIPWLVGEVADRSGSLESGLGALLAFTVALLALHAFHMLGRNRRRRVGQGHGNHKLRTSP